MLGSAGLAVVGVVVAAGAVLLQLKTVRVVAPVLLGDVVALLADRASKRDLRADVCRLGHWCLFLSGVRNWGDRTLEILRLVGSGGGSRTRDTTIMSRVL